jgi:hypothetical protein
MAVEAPQELNRRSGTIAFSAKCENRNSRTQIELVDPLSDSSWDRLVLSHPDFDFFHTAAWARVLCGTYGHKPFYLRISEHNGAITLLPLMEVASRFTGRRGVSLPFSDSCAPLLFHGAKPASAIEKLSALAQDRNWKYVELRGGQTSVFSSNPTFYGHKLDLSASPEDLFSRFTGAARGAIRKAEKSGLTTQVSGHRKAILDFYRLHEQTRRRHGLPPQSKSFFRSIYENILKQRLGFIVFALYGARPVAAAVFFGIGPKSVYKFAASDEKFRDFCGNNLVLWEGIKFLAREGGKILHFGRTALENEGLRRFKLSWGTAEEAIYYSRFNTAANTWTNPGGEVAGFHNQIFRRLPLALNRLVGRLIYPHLD